jgi:hypothetical protein
MGTNGAMQDAAVPACLSQEQREHFSNEERREGGRTHTSSLMIYWLARNNWSHPNLADLAAWALGEEGALHTSQISHMRQGKMRMMGVKVLDAFGAINCAVWAYHQNKELLKNMGIGVVPAKIEGLIKDAEVLINPHNGQPLDAGAFMNVYLGYIKIPGVMKGLAEGAKVDHKKMAAKMTGYIYGRIQKSGKDFPAAKEIAIKTVGEEMAVKIIGAAVGIASFTAKDLAAQIRPIVDALNAIDGKETTVEQVEQELS